MKFDKDHIWGSGLTIVIIGFLIVTIGSVVFYSFQRVDLVEENYYKKELAYEDQIQRLRRTQTLTELPAVTFDAKADSLLLHFPQYIDSPQKVSGTIHFFRPSDARLDFKVPIKLDEQWQQNIAAHRVVDGYWKVQFVWSVENLEYYYEQTITINRED